ncbi:MAG: nicotinamide mononucleotide transporter [Bacteroidaceae bacterium]|nr:nicotinamide mononucleotide transporter [Bacteroidaceae bacterium]MBP3613646.1 nicotinamide mononucleotide transporter [Bacteroidaceae bacterium]
MEQYIEISGTVVGLIYLWQEYRASIYLWITSIIMPAIYLYVYYQAGLYADFGINIYYLVIALYGWLAWRYNFSLRGKRADSKELSIGHISRVTFSHLALLFLAAWAVISYILTHFTNSTVPFTDAFTTALSIVGMYMLARKYIEQWWVWLVVDVVSSALYIYKELYFTAALYALYAIIAIFGYRKWKQLMNNEKH